MGPGRREEEEDLPQCMVRRRGTIPEKSREPERCSCHVTELGECGIEGCPNGSRDAKIEY